MPLLAGFNAPDANEKIAEAESVDIWFYRVIYDAIENVKKLDRAVFWNRNLRSKLLDM